MSAQDNLGRQWNQPELSFTGYRGLTRKPKKEHGLSGVGMHWSADARTARQFAGAYGHVLKAEIPISSVETNTRTLRNNQVFNRDEEGKHPEQEISVGYTKPVKVKEITGPTYDIETRTRYNRPRKRTYNPPREMHG